MVQHAFKLIATEVAPSALPLGASMYYHIKPDLSTISFIFSQLFFGLGPSGLIPEVTVGSLIIGFHQEPFFQLLRGEELFLVDFPIFITHS